MNKRQSDALAILSDGALDETAITVHRVWRTTLDGLVQAGLARWCWSVRRWRITAAGRKVIAQ